MKVKNYQEVIVWQKAMDLVEEVYTEHLGVPTRRDLWAYEPIEAGGCFNTLEYCRGTRQANYSGLPASFVDRVWIVKGS